MVIIVEGIDRVGKTTLCRELEKATGMKRFRDDFRYYDKKYLNKDINTEKINTLLNLIEEGFVENVILDRYHFTEYIYGMLNRKYTNMSMVDIDERIGKMQNVVIILVVPVDIEKSSLEHGSSLEIHNKMFCKMYEISSIKKKIKVNYNEFEYAIDFVKKEMEKCKNER